MDGWNIFAVRALCKRKWRNSRHRGRKSWIKPGAAVLPSVVLKSPPEPPAGNFPTRLSFLSVIPPSINSKPMDNPPKSHPLFPSGEWEGFYLDPRVPGKGQMNLFLHFSDGLVTGRGTDPVGGFSFSGHYNAEGLFCVMTKSYATHEVFYDGRADENGIWGTWSIQGDFSGGFHIWPKKIGKEEYQIEEVEALAELG